MKLRRPAMTNTPTLRASGQHWNCFQKSPCSRCRLAWPFACIYKSKHPFSQRSIDVIRTWTAVERVHQSATAGLHRSPKEPFSEVRVHARTADGFRMLIPPPPPWRFSTKRSFEHGKKVLAALFSKLAEYNLIGWLDSCRHLWLFLFICKVISLCQWTVRAGGACSVFGLNDVMHEHLQNSCSNRSSEFRVPQYKMRELEMQELKNCGVSQQKTVLNTRGTGRAESTQRQLYVFMALLRVSRLRVSAD